MATSRRATQLLGIVTFGALKRRHDPPRKTIHGMLVESLASMRSPGDFQVLDESIGVAWQAGSLSVAWTIESAPAERGQFVALHYVPCAKEWARTEQCCVHTGN